LSDGKEAGELMWEKSVNGRMYVAFGKVQLS
jgi:hypothetical protein